MTKDLGPTGGYVAKNFKEASSVSEIVEALMNYTAVMWSIRPYDYSGRDEQIDSSQTFDWPNFTLYLFIFFLSICPSIQGWPCIELCIKLASSLMWLTLKRVK